MIQISGASDDLVEVEGDVREEFEYHDDQDGGGTLVVLSTGHVFRVLFLPSGWAVRLEAGPEDGPDPALDIRRVAHDGDRDDVVTVNLDVTWIVCGHRIAFAPEHRPESPLAGLTTSTEHTDG